MIETLEQRVRAYREKQKAALALRKAIGMSKPVFSETKSVTKKPFKRLSKRKLNAKRQKRWRERQKLKERPTGI